MTIPNYLGAGVHGSFSAMAEQSTESLAHLMNSASPLCAKWMIAISIGIPLVESSGGHENEH